MSNTNCNDWYGELLKIGDEVYTVFGPYSRVNAKGIIININYNNDGKSYVDIKDKDIIYKNINSYSITTKEHENMYKQHIEYQLVLQGKDYSDYLSLSKNTDENHIINHDINRVYLTHSEEYDGYSISQIELVILDENKHKAFPNKNGELEYFYSKEDKKIIPKFGSLGCEFKMVHNNKEIQKYVNSIIKTFKEIELNKLNQTKEEIKKQLIKTFDKNYQK